jgi:hypothetical protein
MSAVVTSITSVFTAVGNWITTTIPSIVEVFYTEGSLTFLGTLAVIALGISVFFLIMGLIQNFLHFRG